MGMINIYYVFMQTKPKPIRYRTVPVIITSFQVYWKPAVAVDPAVNHNPPSENNQNLQYFIKKN